MRVYSIEEHLGDEGEGSYSLIGLTTSKEEARLFDLEEDIRIREWELEV